MGSKPIIPHQIGHNVLNLIADLAKTLIIKGSVCGTIGWVVASDNRYPWFKSSHFEKFTDVYNPLHWKYEIKEKETGNVPFIKTMQQNWSSANQSKWIELYLKA